MSAKKPRPDLLSVEEVADALDITPRQVWNLINEGKLEDEKISGRTWIPVVELNRYKHIHQGSFLRRALSRFPSADTPGFIRPVNFGPSEQLLTFTRSLSLKYP